MCKPLYICAKPLRCPGSQRQIVYVVRHATCLIRTPESPMWTLVKKFRTSGRRRASKCPNMDQSLVGSAFLTPEELTLEEQTWPKITNVKGSGLKRRRDIA